MKVLIDTNVIIDFLTCRPKFAEQASRVFLNCITKKFPDILLLQNTAMSIM